MAKLRFIKKYGNNPTSGILSFKENIHIARGRKWKKISIGLAIISILELIFIIYRGF